MLTPPRKRRNLTSNFPVEALPSQSPLFWVAEKDRYLRQLLIRDIQAETGRTLLVYFAVVTDPRAQIVIGDDTYFAEMLRDAKGGAVDLMIETPGGFTDPNREDRIGLADTRARPSSRCSMPSKEQSNNACARRLKYCHGPNQ